MRAARLLSYGASAWCPLPFAASPPFAFHRCRTLFPILYLSRSNKCRTKNLHSRISLHPRYARFHHWIRIPCSKIKFSGVIVPGRPRLNSSTTLDNSVPRASSRFLKSSYSTLITHWIPRVLWPYGTDRSSTSVFLHLLSGWRNCFLLQEIFWIKWSTCVYKVGDLDALN